MAIDPSLTPVFLANASAAAGMMWSPRVEDPTYESSAAAVAALPRMTMASRPASQEASAPRRRTAEVRLTSSDSDCRSPPARHRHCQYPVAVPAIVSCPSFIRALQCKNAPTGCRIDIAPSYKCWARS